MNVFACYGRQRYHADGDYWETLVDGERCQMVVAALSPHHAKMVFGYYREGDQPVDVSQWNHTTTSGTARILLVLDNGEI